MKSKSSFSFLLVTVILLVAQVACQKTKEASSQSDEWIAPNPCLQASGRKICGDLQTKDSEGFEANEVVFEAQANGSATYDHMIAETQCRWPNGEVSGPDTIRYPYLAKLAIDSLVPDQAYLASIDHPNQLMDCQLKLTLFNSRGSSRSSAFRIKSVRVSNSEPAKLEFDGQSLIEGKKVLAKEIGRLSLAEPFKETGRLRIVCSDFYTKEFQDTVEKLNGRLIEVLDSAVWDKAKGPDPRSLNTVQTCGYVYRDSQQKTHFSSPFTLVFPRPAVTITSEEVAPIKINKPAPPFHLYKLSIQNQEMIPVTVLLPNIQKEIWVAYFYSVPNQTYAVKGYNTLAYSADKNGILLPLNDRLSVTVKPRSTVNIYIDVTYYAVPDFGPLPVRSSPDPQCTPTIDQALFWNIGHWPQQADLKVEVAARSRDPQSRTPYVFAGHPSGPIEIQGFRPSRTCSDDMDELVRRDRVTN